MAGSIFIVDALRTPIGNFGGALATVPAATLGATVIKQIIERQGLPSNAIDDVILGNVLQAGQGQNPARQAAIEAGIPVETTAMTLNMVCGSGLRAVAEGAKSIICGDASLVIAGGTENMSLSPFIMPANVRQGVKLGHQTLLDSMLHDGLRDAFGDMHMGVTAENLAEKYGITRQEQDTFAVSSQQKAGEAIASGRFKDEIVPVMVPQRKKEPLCFDTDEYPRPETNTISLGSLRPAFKKDGTVTPGNASGINDGAAAVLLADQAAVDQFGLTPIAEIVSWAWAGVEPNVMGIGPVPAVEKALGKANWAINNVELVEANEAFAVQSLAVAKELGLNPDIVNVNGGSIALGHPIGASGCRILVTLVHEMQRRGVARGLATLCIGGGMGIAMCIRTKGERTDREETA